MPASLQVRFAIRLVRSPPELNDNLRAATVAPMPSKRFAAP
jgi:hypothetical protein